MSFYFTSDTHFFHKNIIEYSNRPYSSLRDMQEDMIAKWNSKVKSSDDVVYHLGDFFVGGSSGAQLGLVYRLNGRIRLILGNHDKKIKGAVADRFEWVKCCNEESLNGQLIVMKHYAYRVWNKSHHGSWNLCGHSHGSLKDLGNKQMDVGVDTNDMHPYSFDEIAAIMEKRGFDSPDRHMQRKK